MCVFPHEITGHLRRSATCNTAVGLASGLDYLGSVQSFPPSPSGLRRAGSVQEKVPGGTYVIGAKTDWPATSLNREGEQLGLEQFKADRYRVPEVGGHRFREFVPRQAIAVGEGESGTRIGVRMDA